MTARDLIKELQAVTEAQQGASFVACWRDGGDHNCVAFSGDVWAVLDTMGCLCESLEKQMRERGFLHGDQDTEI